MYSILRSVLITFFLALIFSTSSLIAQTVTGTVKNAETGEPLAGANVIQVDTQNGISTGTDGTFSLSIIKEQSAAIRISFVGYQSKVVQIDDTSEALNILLQPQVKASLREVVVLGNRAGEDDPITQTTVGREEIDQFYAGQSPSAVLERVSPSIVTFSDAGANIGNYVQFRLRGIDQTRINTTLNGVPLNDMIDQGVFFSNFSDFTSSIESVQIQRGVGTTGNGTASYAGSVNFESEDLTKEPEFGFRLTGGSFNTYGVAGEAQSGKFDNNLAFYTRLSRTLSEGYKNHSGSDSYSLFFSGGYLGGNDILKVTAFAGKSQRDQAYLPVLLPVIREDPRTNNNSPNSTDDFEQELVQLQYSRTLNDELTLNSSVYYGGSRGVFPFGLSPTDQLLFGLENNHYGFFSNIDYRESGFKLKAGVHGYLFDRTNENSTAPNTANPTYTDQTDKNEISFFTKTNIKAGNFNFFADLQLRYVNLAFFSDQVVSFGGEVPDRVDTSRDWLFFNPKVGINYNFNRRSSAYISFGRTGREPTRTDILQGDGSAITEANLASARDEDIVEEEYANDLEAGYRFRGSTLSFTANFFYVDFENEISLVGALAENSYVPLRRNVADSYRTGVEFAGEAQLGDKWQASINAAYLTTNVSRFENASGQVFRDVEHIFAPEWTVSPGIRFDASSLFTFSLNGQYVSESFIELSNDSDFTLPEHFVLDGQMDVSISESVKFSLFVNNIFDELYFNEGTPVDADFDGAVEGPGYRVQPPINAYGQLKLKF